MCVSIVCFFVLLQDQPTFYPISYWLYLGCLQVLEMLVRNAPTAMSKSPGCFMFWPGFGVVSHSKLLAFYMSVQCYLIFHLLTFMFLVTSEQRVFFLVFTFNFYSFFGDESIWISCPFENLVYVLLLSSKCSLFILDTSPLSDTCVRNWVVLMGHFIIQWVQPLMNFWVPTRMSEPLMSTFILRSTHIELYRSLLR